MTEKKETKKPQKKEAKEVVKKEAQTSARGMYYYIKQAWKKPDDKTLRERMIAWRASDVFTRVEKPLRLDRARALGYKDKTGFVVIRVRLVRGGHVRPRPNKGRRSKRMHTNKNLKMSYQWIAEQRVSKKFTNLEVLSSYPLGKDGKHYFFEVICVDPQRPEIKNDKNLSWITKPQNQNRPERGITTAGKKSRGLENKSPTSKVRPSVRAGKGRGK
jgi:large subunit ribosomal protein L15e